MLNLDSIVKVNILFSTLAAAPSVFDVGLIIGSTNTTAIGATNRVKAYTSIAEVAEDFASESAPERVAATKYFGVTPAPKKLLIGYADPGSSNPATAAESVDAVLNAIYAINSEWYGVYWAGATSQQLSDINTWLNTKDRGVLFYAEPTTTGVFATMKQNNARRAVGLYTSTPAEAAAVMGEVCGLANAYPTKNWQLCYKSILGIETADLTEANLTTILENNGNAYVTRGFTRKMIEKGSTGSGWRVDEIITIDRIKSDIQNALITLIADNVEKLPQNDSTSALFCSTIAGVLNDYVNSGAIASGVWRGSQIGNIATGDVVEGGYVTYVESFDTQREVDRAARKGMPIRVGICLAGAVESVEINVNVQQ